MMNRRFFALALTILLVLSTFTSCRKTISDESYISDVVSDAIINYDNVEIVEDEGENESTTDSANDTVSDSTSSGDTTTDSTTSVEEPNTNVNPDGVEIYGSGTSDDPYLDSPNVDTHTVKTLAVPAGKSVFYAIYRAGGKIFTINSGNAYVVCDGVKYAAQNGVVSFKVPDALASDAVAFEIGNTGAAEESFSIVFSDIEGSMENPTVIKTVGNKVSISLEEGNDKGYFYSYVAEQTGKLKLYLLSDVSKSVLLATNKRNSAQRSTESTEEGEVKYDENGTYIELEVEKGDEIVINTGSLPNKRGKYPAITIEWMAKY